MLAVTIDNLPGYQIKQVLGEVLGTTARRQNAFMEGVLTQGGREDRKTPDLLRRWREDAVSRMVQAAYDRGGNAVVGMRFDHRPISAMWTEICAYGTAVFVVPVNY
jgi:uncharacterized protein YbjQ (UPF0145 family)